MFTESQKMIIEQCIKDGYGTALFAESVKRQGWCSEKQFETMQMLHGWREYRTNNRPFRAIGSKKKKTRNVYHNCYGEHEATWSDYCDGGFY